MVEPLELCTAVQAGTMQLREPMGTTAILNRNICCPLTKCACRWHALPLQAGTMQLRELTGTVTVGQELPMLRVPAPNAREVK